VHKDVGFVGSVLSWKMSLGSPVDLNWLLEELIPQLSEQ